MAIVPAGAARPPPALRLPFPCGRAPTVPSSRDARHVRLHRGDYQMTKTGDTLRTVKLIFAVLLAVSALVLILQNQEPVRTTLLVWRVEMPRFLLLAIVYGLGVATGWVVFWRSQRPVD